MSNLGWLHKNVERVFRVALYAAFPDFPELLIESLQFAPNKKGECGDQINIIKLARLVGLSNEQFCERLSVFIERSCALIGFRFSLTFDTRVGLCFINYWHLPVDPWLNNDNSNAGIMTHIKIAIDKMKKDRTALIKDRDFNFSVMCVAEHPQFIYMILEDPDDH
jgi:hypothetical protein